MIRRPPRSTQSRSSAASDVYKRQHQQRHAAKQHKHESHAGTMADTDQWTKHSCQDSSSHHPWLEYEVGQRSSGQHAYGHRDLRDHQARTKDFTLHVVRHLRLPDSVVAAVEKWDDERAEKPGDEPDGQRSAKPHEHDTQGGHGHHAPQDTMPHRTPYTLRRGPPQAVMSAPPTTTPTADTVLMIPSVVVGGALMTA